MLAGIISIGSLGMTKGVDAFAMQMIRYDKDGNAIDQQDGMYGIHLNYNYQFLNPEKTEIEISDYLKKDVERMLYFYKKEVILENQRQSRKRIEY